MANIISSSYKNKFSTFHNTSPTLSCHIKLKNTSQSKYISKTEQFYAIQNNTYKNREQQNVFTENYPTTNSSQSIINIVKKNKDIGIDLNYNEICQNLDFLNDDNDIIY